VSMAHVQVLHNERSGACLSLILRGLHPILVWSLCRRRGQGVKTCFYGTILAHLSKIVRFTVVLRPRGDAGWLSDGFCQRGERFYACRDLGKVS
jgi:hypothetical protein